MTHIAKDVVFVIAVFDINENTVGRITVNPITVSVNHICIWEVVCPKVCALILTAITIQAI
jgi:hypothetical protein